MEYEIESMLCSIINSAINVMHSGDSENSVAVKGVQHNFFSTYNSSPFLMLINVLQLFFEYKLLVLKYELSPV